MSLSLQSLPRPNPRSAEPEVLAREIVERLTYRVGKDPKVAKPHDWLQAVILITRDRAIEYWMNATRETYLEGGKRVYYLSLEFLIGRLMRDAVSNLGLTESMRDALKLLDVDYDVIAELEADAALGNGGLGRLAACFMESMATVGVPAYGYGIRYRHGLFRQEILDGNQVELPETWLEHGNPWEFDRLEAAYDICFGGRVEYHEPNGASERYVWIPAEKVKATAYDTPIVGWRAHRVNTLRLWKADPIDPIRLDAFNAGDHTGSLAESNRADALTRVLYPSDTSPAGQELRLRQEYFFSSASLQDILRRHLQQYGRLDNLSEKVAIQLNDTHPAVGVAELMRLLMDIHELDFDEAWRLTQASIAYTNHTLLPEALETWPVPLFERLLPRHMQIIYAINAKLLKSARSDHEMTDAEVRNVSLIDETGERRVRMGNLAFVGAHSINGVAAMHSDLLKVTVFKDLHRMFPDRINNKTNGITPRRWLQQCNPGLTQLLVDTIGPRFLDDIDALRDLEKFADDPGFQDAFARVKRQNKDRLAHLVRDRMGLRLDPNAIFDIQVKRIHEYKRQLLNVIEAVALYDQIRSHPEWNWTPRVKFFAGKAAPTYHNAKLVIKLANDVARVINSNPTVRNVLRVVFIPNYNVSLAEVLVPAADLSEQISTAGMEASGTGNMKFALNGALTIGTLDGANVEIRELVGPDNIVIFGMKAEEVAEARAKGHNPREIIESSPELGQALSAISSGVFSPDDPDRYKALMGGLYEHDWFMVAADFDAYTAAQREVNRIWGEPTEWWHKAILNTARMGWFSSDRTIRQYAEEILGNRRLTAGTEPAPAHWNTTEGRTAVTKEPQGGGAGKAVPSALDPGAIEAIVAGRHGDPFAVLGIQAAGGKLVARAFIDGAEEVEAFTLDDKPAGSLARRHDAGFFEGPLKIRKRQPLKYRARNAGGEWWVGDPYSFGPVLGPMDDYYIREGSHLRLFDKMGAHPLRHEGADGVHFAVWAPNARRVSVVGDFNAWDGRRHTMRLRRDTGIWEIFIPWVEPGLAYKFELIGPDGNRLPLKADPFARASELRPATASIVAPELVHDWGDEAHRAHWGSVDARRQPISIYEVHPGSWQRAADGGFLSWDEMADRLIPYVVDMGFTHIEFLPISEHPYDPSWGYQTTGLYAPTARFGPPEGFARFVDGAHRAGIGVILDWVPAHFPVDEHGLARFDGTALYEHADPRQGFHPDWNTAIYNFGRQEVFSFLINNALYWSEKFHVDGLRVDAVASMLYLDYSRKEGEWIPNELGGRENLAAVAFLQAMNRAVYGEHPGRQTFAEESTSWPKVSAPVYDGGLGFGFKWNMGWMHDTLAYMSHEPVHRQYHHNEMTFGMVYAWSENFVLPLSHDEVVHGKGTLIAKMPGDGWQKFANLRAYYAFMWGYPGKKLLFMGQEFAQGAEWSEERSLDWWQLDLAPHRGVQALVRDLNRLYGTRPALHARDCEPDGFDWLVADDAARSVYAWVRKAPGANPIVVVSNFTPVPREGYGLALPAAGRWREILNTDAAVYDGSGLGNMGGVDAVAGDQGIGALVTLPPLATIWLELEPGATGK